MYAMQYTIPLPADYDMNVIRERVRVRGAMLDAFPGLGLKAYLIRERGKDGALVNQYAPFYLWASIDGMSRFLWGGGGFGALVASFGRPVVHHWTGVGFVRGPAFESRPHAASIRTEYVPADTDPAEFASHALNCARSRALISGVHSAAIAIDPYAWKLTHFTLWESNVSDNSGEAYEVLHLCTPNMHMLFSGAETGLSS